MMTNENSVYPGLFYYILGMPPTPYELEKMYREMSKFGNFGVTTKIF